MMMHAIHQILRTQGKTKNKQNVCNLLPYSLRDQWKVVESYFFRRKEVKNGGRASKQGIIKTGHR